MEIITYKPHKVPKKIHSRLSKLHFKDGLMWDSYNYHRDIKNNDTRVVVAFIDNKAVGWCLGMPRKINRSSFIEIHVYVQRAYRRQKIGTCLVKRIKRYAPEKRMDRILYYDSEDIANSFYYSIFG